MEDRRWAKTFSTEKAVVAQIDKANVLAVLRFQP